MAKVRIYQLARETGVPADDILAAARKMGIEVKSSLSPSLRLLIACRPWWNPMGEANSGPSCVHRCPQCKSFRATRCRM